MSVVRASKSHNPKGYIYGFDVTYNSATRVNIGPGACRDSSDTVDIDTTGTVSAIITTVGAGGLRSGLIEAVSTWYYVFIIASSTGAVGRAGFLDTSTTPVLPAGYDIYRRVGCVYNDSSGNFQAFLVVKRAGEMREVHWRVDAGNTSLVLNRGTSTTFASVSCANLVPPTANAVFLENYGFYGPVDGSFTFRAPQDSTANPPVTLQSGAEGGSPRTGETALFYLGMNNTQSFSYKMGGSAVWNYVYVVGYVEQL